MATKRKDSHRIVLKKGEYQRTNGTYAYRWTDGKGKRHEVYARDLDDLRAKEKEIDADTNEGLKVEARYVIINEMYDLWATSICITLLYVRLLVRKGFRP